MAMLTYFVFGGQYDTGIIIGIVSLTLSCAFDMFAAIERMYNKFTKDD
ncbi:MAG: hypothetical protein MJ246_07400 [Clostridia bacterium]|nr:hypothetical protein [Clostridia bacterium]